MGEILNFKRIVKIDGPMSLPCDNSNGVMALLHEVTNGFSNSLTAQLAKGLLDCDFGAGT